MATQNSVTFNSDTYSNSDTLLVKNVPIRISERFRKKKSQKVFFEFSTENRL